MLEWIRGLLGLKPTDERVLDLERDLQRLRLELEEREQAVARLTEELERHRSGAGARVAESVQAQVERLLADGAGPVSQLHTQAHLLEVEGRPVQARDVLAVARRFVRLFEDAGLTLEGAVGERVTFDPDRHEPLSAAARIEPGRPVVVRFVGVAYQGQLLRKAGVEEAED